MLRRLLMLLLAAFLLSAQAEESFLTDEECLALSNMCYNYANFYEGMTVAEYWEGDWDRKWFFNDACEVTIEMMYGSMRKLSVLGVFENKENGFAAVVFEDESDRCVIAIVGAAPLRYLDETDKKAAAADWVKNGVAMQILGRVSDNSQLESALALYDALAESGKYKEMLVTGHSLGGGLAYVVSVYSGARAVCFNSVSAMTTAYTNFPERLAKGFLGADKWNFVDHINEKDLLSGQFGKDVKVYQEHYTNQPGNGQYLHGAESLIDLKTGRLTEVKAAYMPEDMIYVNTGLLNGGRLYLGTSRSETIDASGEDRRKTYIFGGEGDDEIFTGLGADVIVPGYGQNVCKDEGGSDTYILLKDAGFTRIEDTIGRNKIVLSGYDSWDGFEVEKSTSHMKIYYEGKEIADVFGGGFTLSVNGETLK